MSVATPLFYNSQDKPHYELCIMNYELPKAKPIMNYEL